MTTQFKVSLELRGELSFSFLNYTLKAGQLISLSDDIASSYEVQIALGRNLISPVIKSEESPVIKSEEIVEKKEKITRSPKANTKRTLKEEIPDEVVTERKTTMLAYDMENQEVLQKGKSQKIALEQMNIQDKTTEVLVGDKIDFDAAEKKQATKKATSKKEKKGGIKPVGTKREEAVDDTDNILIDGNTFSDISFVDEEQEKIRANSRPILQDNNNEVL